jgi:hypothetical protein
VDVDRTGGIHRSDGDGTIPVSWTYEQLSGRLFAPDGSLVGIGYSGAGQWKNRPGAQEMKDKGPIPTGQYIIHEPIDSMTHGPRALPLSPHKDNQMFGRGSFLIHGDSVVEPGTASEGCIIQSRDVREKIAASNDHDLLVISGLAGDTVDA